MKYITSIELKEKLDNKEACQLIDTRDCEKFAECHIEGSLNIPQIEFPESIHLISKDVPVIIYCLYGVKSQSPYLYLTEKKQFKNIFILEGGLFQWATEIEPQMPVL